MKDDWHNPRFAQHWDRTAAKGNPSRIEQLELLVFLLANRLRPGAALLDLGIGSGQVEEKLFTLRPDIRVVGVDASEAMLDLARLRLGPDRCRLIRHDLMDIESLKAPDAPFQAAISVQTLHHLPQERQKDVVRFIHHHLEPGGLFLLMDRIDLADAPLHPVCADMWDWLEQRTDQPSGKRGEQFLAGLRCKDDHPASLEEHLDWLKKAGFSAGCLHLSLNRALFASVKI
jgi:tRNA (cmo5U34)-methyltransferase